MKVTKTFRRLLQTLKGKKIMVDGDTGKLLEIGTDFITIEASDSSQPYTVATFQISRISYIRH